MQIFWTIWSILTIFGKKTKWRPDNVIPEAVKTLTDQAQVQSPTCPGTLTPLTEISRKFDEN